MIITPKDDYFFKIINTQNRWKTLENQKKDVKNMKNSTFDTEW